MLERQAAAGLDEPGRAQGQRDGDTGRHQGPPATRGEGDGLGRSQVGAGIARMGVGGGGEVGVEADDRDVEHDGTLLRRRPT